MYFSRNNHIFININFTHANFMDVSVKKLELINWLRQVTDATLLTKIEKLKEQHMNHKPPRPIAFNEAKKISISMIDEWEIM